MITGGMVTVETRGRWARHGGVDTIIGPLTYIAPGLPRRGLPDLRSTPAPVGGSTCDASPQSP